jgi:hypothetical protein
MNYEEQNVIFLLLFVIIIYTKKLAYRLVLVSYVLRPVLVLFLLGNQCHCLICSVLQCSFSCYCVVWQSKYSFILVLNEFTGEIYAFHILRGKKKAMKTLHRESSVVLVRAG